MRDLRQGVFNLEVESEEEVLQQKVPGVKSSEKARGLRTVRDSDSDEEVQREGQILQQDVRLSVVGRKPKHDKISGENSQRVHSDSHAKPSKRGKKRVRDGASACHGDSSGKASHGGRSSTPQKRGEGRQPTRESRTDEQEATRLPAKTKKAEGLSELRMRDNSNQVCPSCGSDLTIPGRVVPGIVCDPFSGSGTTAGEAVKLGRRFVAIDIRLSQVELTLRRVRQARLERGFDIEG